MQKKLILFNGYEIIQDDRFLKLTQDTALLSDFVQLKRGDHVFDFGVGIGSLSILLLVKNDGVYTNGIEILPEAAELARENIKRCGFCQRGSVEVGDFKAIKDNGRNKYQVCVSNPPYFDTSRGKVHNDPTMAASRSQENGDIFDVCRGARALLNWGGRLYFCYKPERIDTAMKALHSNNFSVKRMRFVHQSVDKAANLVLIEARLGGGEWCRLEPPLVVDNVSRVGKVT